MDTLVIEMMRAMQSVQISVGDWWGLTAFRDGAFRAEVVVDGSVAESLNSEWTMQAFAKALI